MSDSTGTPAAAPTAPAPAPAPAPGGQLGIIAPSAPPAAAQPGISVSEAARLLNKQRRQGGDAAEAAPATEARKPSANDLTKRANDNVATANDNATTKAAPAAASALERALGTAPEGVAPPAPADPNDGAIVEIEGQRLRTPEEIKAFVERKSYDYTKKMQELSEHRQAVQAQAQHIAAQQQALATVLPYIQPELARLQQIVQQDAQKPDVAMIQTDPQRYFQELAQYESTREEQQRLGSLNALQQQAQARAMEQQVAQAHEQLAREFPFWADPQQRTQLQHEIVAWATNQGGFSRDELRGLAAPHHFKTMMKAAMYDKMAAGAKSTAPPQRLQAPVRGAAPPPAPTERIQVAEKAFSERPNIRSAAQLLAARRAQ